MQKALLEILNNKKYIQDFHDISYIKAYNNNDYETIYRINIYINSTSIPVIMGIPTLWDRKLIDIYLEGYKSMKFMPHIDNKGKICLFDLEGVLIDKCFTGLVNQTLDRAYTVLRAGINEENKIDFINEFDSYWLMMNNSKTITSMVNPHTNGNVKIIKYADNVQKKIKKKNEKYIDMLSRTNVYKFIASDNALSIKKYKDFNNARNGLFIHIESNEYVYPPDWRFDLDIEYINVLLSNVTNPEVIKELLLKCGSDLLLIINVLQPNGTECMIGAYIKNYKINNNPKVVFNDSKVIPCYINRCERNFLLNRGGGNTQLGNAKLLVIGCGSIGGFLVSYLVKAGAHKLTIVDDDKLREENIYRHNLGLRYVKRYKTEAIAEDINNNMPDINIISYVGTIEDAIYNQEIDLTDYDVIISAVGNHNVNRWLNELTAEKKIQIPVIYLWNEVLGIGNHAAFITNTHDGCYECFFGRDDIGIYDKTSFSKRGQIYTKKVQGCGSSYLPFGAINSITTALMGIDLLIKYIEGRIDTNILLSKKGEDYYFNKMGYETSERYKKVETLTKVVFGHQFKNKKCSICVEVNK